MGKEVEPKPVREEQQEVKGHKRANNVSGASDLSRVIPSFCITQIRVIEIGDNLQVTWIELRAAGRREGISE